MNHERATDEVGSSVKFTFYGTKARAYGTLDKKSGGSFDVFVDNEYVESMTLRWGGPMSKLYQTGLLPEGRHILELKAAVFRENSNAAIDAFAFESPANEIRD